MKIYQRALVAGLSMTLATTGLAALTPTAASAAVIGSVNVTVAGATPSSGTDASQFSGSVTAACPAGTNDSYFDIIGNDIGPGAPAGTGEIGALGQGSSTGQGPQSFTGANISNLRSTNAGAFATSGPYRIRFNCVKGAATLDTYETTMNYVAGTGGFFTIVAPAAPARSTTTVLTATPPGPFEAGTLTNLAADVTPTTGADDATGSVEFRNNGTLIDSDNSVPFTLANVSLPVGTNNLTAVFIPAVPANFNGSTSNTVAVTVTAVEPRQTAAVLTVSPTSGNAFASVTLTCAVSGGTFSPNGTVTFTDAGIAIGSSPVVNGVSAVLTGSFSTPGAHSFMCNFVGAAPYQNSTSAAVTATYLNAGAVPDTQTVIVEIPGGVLTITTPYTPSSPLSLGVATLNQADSTYSASAQFGTAAAGYIVVTDTRAGNLGWNASVLAGAFVNGASSFPGTHAGLTALTRVPLLGNAATAVAVTNHTPNVAGGLGTSKSFATYPAGQPLGTVQLTGLFGIAGVPTSVTPGVYTSTVTFTAV